ncbi:sulfurtransferase complex subunit TusB [Parashewanella spongiae]|uniref:Sulfurtransferase complex subunit TusB n=1 Tax=Parashewanella spongiae TaxID=342950 RepID=A0A3A6UN78_9GAMM|nr:sulfurtransferase complex subunit TusB [Parashewanella spongiae]MCL1076866.1 sulfurtransferase complex subunit TusB [Parashewanella spongiae]RJY19233.1 sulfurtransferase complex subunit TusB [Parashewanella spongiae]
MDIHFIQTSLNQDNALELCLKYKNDDDLIILAGSAVSGLLQKQWQRKLLNIDVKILSDDIMAQGLAEKLKHFDAINYQQFIEQTLKYNKVISW